jgi:NAD(P)-dependent dehydrogenase (short-subunit alcohol dehydrogenase family)
MDVVVITGCSRGIGLGLVKEFCKRNVQLIATCRNPKSATELAQVLKEHGQAEACPLDLTSKESVQSLADTIKIKYGKIDILLNNAGLATKNHPHDPPQDLDTKEMMLLFETNVAGTCLVTQTLLPLLKQSENPRVLCISSFLGSISKNAPSETNFYMATSYRCSKSALNQLVRCFSLSVPEITFLSVSPGHVQTDMGNAAGRTAPLTVGQVSDKISDLCMNMKKENSGAFMDFTGENIPY